MSVTVYEKPTSRDSVLALDRSSSITYEIFAIATAGENETQVIAAVEALTKYLYTGFDFLALKKIHVKPRGGPYWEGSVEFGLPPGPSQSGSQGNNSQSQSGDPTDQGDQTALDNSVSFEIGGGTTHLVSSLQTISQAVAPGSAIPPTKNMIGLDKQRINGVDVVAPNFHFSKTIVFQTLTLGYLKNLRWVCGSVNANTFLSFPRGELLLEGVSGQYRAGSTSNPLGSWSATFKFAVEKNRVGILVGDIPAFDKLGWDYVWFGYQDKYDAPSGLTIPTPIYASVERVYYFIDFTKLGFGP